MRNPWLAMARAMWLVMPILAAGLLLTAPARVVGAERTSLDRFARSQMVERRIPGMAIAVIKDGKVEAIRTYGDASIEFDQPVRRDTPFSVASVSKSFTAVAIMQLVERRQLTLDDRIGAHLIELPAAWRDVTVRQLLNHTSGLPDLSVDNYTTNTVAQTREEAYEVLSHRSMDFASGTAYRYNQTNYMLLGLLLAAKRGRPFTIAIGESLFASTGAKQPVFGDARSILKGRASTYTPYRYTASRPIQLDHLEVLNAEMPEIMYPAGGLNISIEDFSAWLLALLDGRLIGRDSLQALWEPAKLANGSTFERPSSPSLWTRYGLGWVLGEHDGHAFAGGTGGIRCAFFVYPHDGLAVIVLTNAQGSGPEALVQGIARRYLPQQQGRR